MILIDNNNLNNKIQILFTYNIQISLFPLFFLNSFMIKTIFLLMILSPVSFSQEFEKWEKKEISYSGELVINRAEKSGFLNAVKDVYRFLISDVDGDNCPFTPTCSSFFTEAASEYGIISGGLMFADRFTRDMNLLKGNKYPLSSEGSLSDPPGLYIFNKETVKSALQNLNSHE